jgi:hypothetical protein
MSAIQILLHFYIFLVRNLDCYAVILKSQSHYHLLLIPVSLFCGRSGAQLK